MKKQLSKKEIKNLNSELEKYDISFDKKDKIELVDNKIFVINNEPKFFYHENIIVPTLKTLLENNFLKNITVDMGAIRFVTNGADIMRPGITKADESIKKDDVVTIIDETHAKPIGVGLALFDGEEIMSKDGGKVVKNLHFVGDDIWKL